MRLPNRHRGFVLLLIALPLVALAAPGARAAEPRKPLEYVDGVPDTGQFLPNSEVLARVADRKVSVLDFRQAYFGSDPQIRPSNDSLGRAELLTNMMRKDVLGLTALAAGYSLNFEDRATLRATRETILSNRLFETAVLDVPAVPEDSVRKVFEFYRFDQKLRMLQFPDRETAEASRRAVLQGRTAWGTLTARYAPRSLQSTAGEFNWSHFENLPVDLGLVLWRLKPGELSPVIPSSGGYQLYQAIERRDRPAPSYEVMRPIIQNTLKTFATGLRRLAITEEAKRGMNVRYDSVNVRFAARLYSPAVRAGDAGGELVIDENVPEISLQDTARTILEWDGGRISLGHLSHSYSDLPAVMRPSINTPERLMEYADAVMLEPRMVDLAVERGLDKDPVVQAKYARKLEEILVGKLVEDSCFSRITVSPKERRDYYSKNRSGFTTFPMVRYAIVVRDSREAAEAIKARLEAGESVAGIVHADSLRGETRSGLKEARSNDHVWYQKLLFEEMREGQTRVIGPDREKAWACLRLITFDPGHLLPFEEVEGIIDESIRNLKSEKALNQFVAAHMTRYPTVARYDLLMRVRLTTPMKDEVE